VASRRKCEEFIRQGRVAVNGQTAALGAKVDPEHDHIELDGEPIEGPEDRIYIVLNKPEGYITTVSDPAGRPTVMELIEDIDRRVYPVGRLDADTRGLLLLTNDGVLTNRLLHPRYERDKTYLVRVEGFVCPEVVDRLRAGVELHDGRTAPAEASVLERESEDSLLRLTIHEGRNRQIRRMMKQVEHPVVDLVRVAVGPLSLGTLETGRWRCLTPEEVEVLKEYAGVTD
jgi:pseudouridine synthase